MQKKIFKMCMIGALAIGLGACSDKDDLTPENPGEGSGSMEQYSAEQSKLFLEKTANEALTLLNPDDQRDLIELCSYFTDRYDSYDLPDNFDVEKDNRSYLKSFFRDLHNGTRSGDGAGITRAAVEYVYSIDFNNFKGIYEADDSRREWVKTGDSKDVIFRFTNNAGQSCELKATGSSNASSGNFTWTDSDYGYRENYKVDFRLPTELNLTLTQGGAQMASAIINSNINLDGHNFNLVVNATAANIKATCKMEGTDTKISESTSTTVSGKDYATTYAEANGNHLCDISFYNRYFGENKDNEAALSQMLTKGSATATVLGKVSVDGTITYSSELWDAFELWAEDMTTANKYVNTLNGNLTGIVRYNGTTTEQARLKWDAKPTRWDDYEIEPMLVFPDGTSYFFTDYFTSGFSSVENLWRSLTRKYESIWDSMQGLYYPDDDDPGMDNPVSFKEYNYLLGKTRDQVIGSVPFSVSEQEIGALYYWNINTDNVSDLYVYFTFWDYDDRDALITYDKCVAVFETVSGLTWETVVRQLSDQYGSPIYVPDYDEEGNLDPDYTYYQYEKSGQYICLYLDFTIGYLNKAEWDKVLGGTRAGQKNLNRVLRTKLLERGK